MKRTGKQRQRTRFWRKYANYVLGHHERWTKEAIPFIKELRAIRSQLRHRLVTQHDEVILDAMIRGHCYVSINQVIWVSGDKIVDGSIYYKGEFDGQAGDGSGGGVGSTT